MSFLKPLNLGLRALAFFCSFIVMALTGNMVSDWGRGNGGTINYSLFVSVWGMLTLLYLIPATLKESLVFHPILPLLLDILNCIFWFCGAVALAAKLGAHNCNNQSWVKSNYIIAGSKSRCREAQAADVFMFFGFFAFLLSCIASGFGNRGGANLRPGGVRGPPVMAQV
ncbi:hypothetical protein K470DRAFT_256944 [Piedraia hortae CBS 480.64]|uniref:MARVEL domain-containing protein n=1 Tax=Piedraia hortae CBS 480.64 TaxID=1314780 RepID=A0A6A7C128_9PEZI|nr:hypothetical protein K470DRAFT_256944 [Piedraia hortae CBS 480.64]